jgi:hypothetical protein
MITIRRNGTVIIMYPDPLETKPAVAMDANKSELNSSVRSHLNAVVFKGSLLETNTSMPVGSCPSIKAISWLNLFKIAPLSVLERYDEEALLSKISKGRSKYRR